MNAQRVLSGRCCTSSWRMENGLLVLRFMLMKVVGNTSAIKSHSANWRSILGSSEFTFIHKVSRQTFAPISLSLFRWSEADSPLFNSTHESHQRSLQLHSRRGLSDLMPKDFPLVAPESHETWLFFGRVSLSGFIFSFSSDSIAANFYDGF